MGLLFAFFSSFSAFALSPEIIVCSEPGKPHYVELNISAGEAVMKSVDSDETEVMTFLDTDSGILFYEGPVHIFDFTFRQGATRGIGNSTLANRETYQTMWCHFKTK